LQPVAGLDAHPPRPSPGGPRWARCSCLLPLRQRVLRCARFPGAAACPCDSGSFFLSKSTIAPHASHVGLDFADRHRAGVSAFFFFALDGKWHSALRAELHLADLNISVPLP